MADVMYRYRKPGHFIPGIPARDLSTEEYMEMERAQRERVAKSDLYERVKHTRKTATIEGPTGPHQEADDASN